MDMETVLVILQSQSQAQFAHLITKVTEMETVLSHLSQSYVILDLLAMDQEVAFQLLFQPLQLAQVDTSQMDKDSVFQM